MPSRYLRRLSRKHYDSQGTIFAKAFECRPAREDREAETEVSFTRIPDGTDQEQGCFVERYWHHPWLKQGDRPGLCYVTDADCKDAKVPSPRFSRDDDDDTFGHLHHILDCPGSDSAEVLAKLAQKHGFLKYYYDGKKQKLRTVASEPSSTSPSAQ